MPLRLVHLSDIHFQGYGGTVWDADADQRSELLKDLKGVVGSDPIDGIIVGGDIAFSGDPDEYTTAKEWLAKLADQCKVDLSRVWVVPGNHDVNRTVIGESAAAKDFRRAIRACNVGGIDEELWERLGKDPAGEGVMMPFSNFNVFAGEFGCGTTAQQPHWYDDTLSCGGLPVRLTGLNSALVSDGSDNKEKDECKLVLGRVQCTLPRDDHLVHIAISHHPKQWLRDWEVVEPYLRRAHLVLFGHEHLFGAEQSEPEKTVFVYAGAVGPERLGGDASGQYLPSWGFITIERRGDLLHVWVAPRVWHRGDTCFGEHPDGVREFDVRVDLMEQGKRITGEEGGADTAGIDASPLIPPDFREMAGEPAPTTSERRSLGVRFSSLPVSRKLEIARKLGVLEEPGDLELPRPKFSETILTRIRERDLIESLERELERA